MKVAAVCIARNEPHINEWIAYHRSFGFTPFIILSNWKPEFSIKAEFTIDNSLQVAAYNNWIRIHGKKFDYAAFFDADEYFYSEIPLKKLLQACPGNLTLNWLFFGNSLVTGRDGVVNKYVVRAKEPHVEIKTIVKLTEGVQMVSPHYANTVGYDTDNRIVYKAVNAARPVDKAFLAHYYLQDVFHWDRKMKRARIDNRQPYPPGLRERNRASDNIVCDKRLFEYYQTVINKYKHDN